MENLLGTRIKAILDERHLSVNKIEQMADIPRGSIRAIIVGKSLNPTVNILVKLCNTLQCSLYDIIGSEDPSKTVLPEDKNPNYGNKEWDFEVFKKCTEIIQTYLSDNKLNFKLDKVVNLIIDLYVYAVTQNNKQIDKNIDKKFIHWLFEKNSNSHESKI